MWLRFKKRAADAFEQQTSRALEASLKRQKYNFDTISFHSLPAELWLDSSPKERRVYQGVNRLSRIRIENQNVALIEALIPAIEVEQVQNRSGDSIRGLIAKLSRSLYFKTARGGWHG